MLKKIKRKFNYFFIFLTSILIIFFTTNNILYAANLNWIEISKTSAGIQYLDKNSLDSQGKRIIEVTTKYVKIDTNTSKEIEENIYIMKINCLTNKFKDISVNGKMNSTAKWEEPNGDKLLDDVISYSCQNV